MDIIKKKNKKVEDKASTFLFFIQRKIYYSYNGILY